MIWAFEVRMHLQFDHFFLRYFVSFHQTGLLFFAYFSLVLFPFTFSEIPSGYHRLFPFPKLLAAVHIVVVQFFNPTLQNSIARMDFLEDP